jgi:hypothetical protein
MTSTAAAYQAIPINLEEYFAATTGGASPTATYSSVDRRKEWALAGVSVAVLTLVLFVVGISVHHHKHHHHSGEVAIMLSNQPISVTKTLQESAFGDLLLRQEPPEKLEFALEDEEIFDELYEELNEEEDQSFDDDDALLYEKDIEENVIVREYEEEQAYAEDDFVDDSGSQDDESYDESEDDTEQEEWIEEYP